MTEAATEANLAKRKTLPPPPSTQIKHKIADARLQKNYGYEFKLYSHTLNFSLKKNQYVLVNIEDAEPIIYSSNLFISPATDSQHYPEFAGIESNLKEKEKKVFPMPYVIENTGDAEKILGISCQGEILQINMKDYPFGLYLRSDVFIAATDGIKFNVYKFEEDDQILWNKISGNGYIWTKLPQNSNVIAQELTFTQSLGMNIENIIAFAHSGNEEPNLKIQKTALITRSSKIRVSGPGNLLISSIPFKKMIIETNPKKEIEEIENNEKKSPAKGNTDDVWRIIDSASEEDPQKKANEETNGEDSSIEFPLQKQPNDNNNNSSIEENENESEKDAEHEGFI